MRIAQYCQSVFNVSRGTETFVKSISLELAKRCEVHLLAGEGGSKLDVRAFSGRTLRTFSFPYLKRTDLPSTLPREWQYAAECGTFYMKSASHFRSHKYDAIHIHLPLNLMLKSVTHDPILLNFHGGGSIVSYQDILKSTEADSYCACSKFIADWAKRTIRKPVHVVHDGVDPDYFRPMQVQRPRKFILFSIGALLWWKGFEYLLEAMRIVQGKDKDIELWIAGSGADVEAIMKRSERLGLRNTKFLGYAMQEDVVKLYNKCDAFISASPEEPFGITFVEAMACGKPVIAANNAGPKEIVAKGTGFLAKPRSASDLAAKIMEAKGSDLVGMGEGARRHVMKNFTWKRTADSLLKIYRKM
ncbi:MAG: glycosyltransferase family 4 protein [Candidatus Aenigmarchaeota archaeon]|nr:glycosyltransferase family 4 protein [Candidatus Aenigmarchaeota archaeon]